MSKWDGVVGSRSHAPAQNIDKSLAVLNRADLTLHDVQV